MFIQNPELMPPSRTDILFVCQLPPPVHGAALMNERVVSLARRIAVVDLLPISMKEPISSLGRFSVGKVARSAGLFFQLLLRLLSRRPRVVYLPFTVYGFAFVRDVALAAACRLLGVRRIFHLHMAGLKARYKHSAAYRLLADFAFSGATVIHVSDRMYRDIEPIARKVKFHVLPNGISDPYPQGPPAQRVSEAPPRVLYFSNLLIDKGPLDLLEASRILSKDGVRHQLSFVGDPRQEAVSTQLQAAQAESAGGISVRPGVFGDEKWPMLTAADIFVLPSWSECLPLVIIEAMAAGLAIVATDVGGVADLLDDGKAGLLVRAREPVELAAAIARLCEDRDLRASLGRAARARYLEKYTINHFERGLARLIEEFIAGPA